LRYKKTVVVRYGIAAAFAGLLLVAPQFSNAATSATYSGLKPDEFLTRWLILKPIPVHSQPWRPDEAAQKAAFAKDWLAEQGGESAVQPVAERTVKLGELERQWRLVESTTDIVDLMRGGGTTDYAVAYAWAEIDIPAAKKGWLGIGSDDAVKVWLNGKLIHEDWADRAARADDDVVPIEFASGKNQLLLKIQNREDQWGFACRLLSPESLSMQLTKAAAAVDTDKVKKLLDQGVDINGRDKLGLTPFLAARLRGQTEMMEFLAAHGANTNASIPPLQGMIDGLFTMLVKSNAAGVSVLAARDGLVLFEKGYGLADMVHEIPATTETKFRIGSISKQFTAAAILKLQEQGKLSVTDKLSKYIPDWPRGDEVTLHHLLTHTSGIHSYTDKSDFMQKVTNSVQTLELINSFKDDPYDFDPGKKWKYDNSGYFLLGYIVEKVSAQNYADFLRQNFFAPLGMTNTGVHRADLKLANEALGYSYENGRFTPAVNWDMSWAGGAGALYSTVGDLYRWNEALFGGKVLSAASLKAAFTAVRTEESKDEKVEDGYGYGWGVSHFRGVEEISHGGGLNGFSTYLLRLPEQHFTAAVLANALPGDPAAGTSGLAHSVAELCVGTELKPRPVIQANSDLSVAALDAVTGRYDYGIGILTVTREGKRLFAQLGQQPRVELFPKSETEFFWKVVDAQVSFFKDKDGNVTKAVHHQSGQTINAPKLKDIAQAKVDPTTYEAFLGKYDYGEGKAIMTVTREGNHLYAQLSGQPKFEIFPSSANEFFWKVVDAQVTFVKGSEGKVTKVIHHQGGHSFEAPRLD
jgi:CubicO group peptidase (beta-lactamase class C family)